MKWKKKKKSYTPSPSHGDLRTVRKFLWFPKTIDEETRWLCFGTYEQKYYVIQGKATVSHPERTWGCRWWADKKWIDKKEKANE